MKVKTQHIKKNKTTHWKNRTQWVLKNQLRQSKGVYNQQAQQTALQIRRFSSGRENWREAGFLKRGLEREKLQS